MRLTRLCLVIILMLGLSASAARAASDYQTAAASLARDPVYVDPSAERALDSGETEALRRSIRASGAAVFIAVLPAATAPTAAEASRAPRDLAAATGLSGTYAVVVGDRFRAASTDVANAGELATASFQARSRDGTASVLTDFIDRIAASQATRTRQPDGGSGSSQSPDGGGGSPAWIPLALLGAGGVGLLAWSRSRRRKRQQEAEAELSADRELLRAELAVLAEDVIRIEPEVLVNPDARDDYEAAVGRYRAAEAALDYADEPVDLVRVERVVREAQYAMSRAKAIIRGQAPPDPPAELRQGGRHDEPPVDVDEAGRPYYVGYGGPFYGGGWFGGGGGLLSGLLLGSMLGGWGAGWGGHHAETDDHSGDGGWTDGGGIGGGDWGGDAGGGDWS
jgi:hypothetical protein